MMLVMKKLNERIFGLMAGALAVCLPAAGEVVTYPAGDGVPVSTDYEVFVRQGAAEPLRPVAVYPVKVDKVEGARHVAQTASMAYFDFSGDVEVLVVPKNIGDAGIDSVRIRPLSKEINHRLLGDTINFGLSSPENISVEVNGDIFHNLHLFANPLDVNRPDARTMKKLSRFAAKKPGEPVKFGKWVYFAPGVYKLPGDSMRIESGARVYVDGGARVYGRLLATDVSDVRFWGRGEIHPAGRGEGIYISRCRDVEAEGVIVTQIPVGGSDGVRIENVKSISYYGWGDGMNVFASDNVSYDRVFCRNSDDCSTVYATRKGFTGGCRNILMENSTLWADVAHPIFIGLHGNVELPDTIENVTYRNIDILDHAENQIDYQGCMAINAGDNNLVRDVLFDNIRVEDFRKGQLVNVRIFFNKKYCGAPGQRIENVTFRDVTYNGSGENLSIISGYDADHKVVGVTFENLVINGKHISDTMEGKPKWYKTSDFAGMYVGDHVENVTFK